MSSPYSWEKVPDFKGLSLETRYKKIIAAYNDELDQSSHYYWDSEHGIYQKIHENCPKEITKAVQKDIYVIIEACQAELNTKKFTTATTELAINYHRKPSALEQWHIDQPDYFIEEEKKVITKDLTDRDDEPVSPEIGKTKVIQKFEELIGAIEDKERKQIELEDSIKLGVHEPIKNTNIYSPPGKTVQTTLVPYTPTNVFKNLNDKKRENGSCEGGPLKKRKPDEDQVIQVVATMENSVGQPVLKHTLDKINEIQIDLSKIKDQQLREYAIKINGSYKLINQQAERIAALEARHEDLRKNCKEQEFKVWKKEANKEEKGSLYSRIMRLEGMMDFPYAICKRMAEKDPTLRSNLLKN